jgi:hypothetical protein
MTQRDGGDPKRLTDDSGMPRTPDWAVDLLRSASPYEPPPGRKQRVREGLAQKSSRRAPVWLRTAVVAAVLIGGGAVARAAFGHWPGWIVRVYRSLVAPSAPSEPVAAVPPRTRPHRSPAAAPAVGPASIGADAPVLTPAPAVAVASRSAPLPSREAAPAPRAPRRVAVAAAAHEDTLVLEAMRALRVQRNPVRARSLLSRYLASHPNGELAEEALALSIEAAVAHQDADAASLAARYLSRYPSGPFHGLAQKTLSQR